jgi:hypothetical protein
MLETADKVQTGSVVNPDSFKARLKRPKEMDEVAHRQMLGVVQFLLRTGEIEEPIRSLVTADTLLGTLGGVSQRAKLLVTHAGVMCQAQSGN